MLGSIKKTIAYAKRNGIAAAYYAAKERLEDQKKEYNFIPASDKELSRQKEETKSVWESDIAPLFSILVPCYNTDSKFFIEMVESVVCQTYPKWELILADASADERLKNLLLDRFKDDNRIIYIHLKSNGGISDNTNEALKAAKGDYVCLLDHDDVITPDALYYFAKEILDEMESSKPDKLSDCPIGLIYSDEDKCDTDMTRFYEPNIKPCYNLDYLLSNNYICHFTSIRADIIQKEMFRKEYDGAQDFDLILRTCLSLSMDDNDRDIRHIDKVLYHWRCHEASTAANPASKKYAYDAGKRAVYDILNAKGINANVSELMHVGFYRVEYPDGIFRSRKDIGVIGGKLVDKKGTLVGGIYKEDGSIVYYGLPKGYSGGFTHIAACQQDADAVDLRCMRIRKKLRPLLKEVTGLTYHSNNEMLKQKDTFTDPEDETVLKSKVGHIIIPDNWDDDKIKKESIRFCRAVRHLGYRVVWDPKMVQKKTDIKD